MRQHQTDTGWIAAGWPAPSHIHAGVTTRTGGVSIGPYASLNLATHVGDQADTVISNRKLLRDNLRLPEEPAWLEQVHSNAVVTLSRRAGGRPALADGAYTRQKNRVCAVLTADCLPLLLCAIDGQEIAAIHMGWRGHCAGIITRALAKFSASPGNLLAWIGPFIDVKNYEVGSEVRDACLNITGEAGVTAFLPGRPGHGYADLGMLAKQTLQEQGVTHIYAARLCTYSEPAKFFSYRRDGNTGRQASLIWMT